MCKRGPASERGASLIQIMAVIAIAGIIIFASMPPLRELHERMTLDAAARRVMSDVRGTRSLAVTTGWEYRFVGLAANGDYRWIGRRSNAVAWPLVTEAPFAGADQFASDWVDFDRVFPGLKLRPFDPGAPSEYWISFDSRGVPFESSVGLLPVTLLDDKGKSRLIDVSATGRIDLD